MGGGLKTKGGGGDDVGEGTGWGMGGINGQ